MIVSVFKASVGFSRSIQPFGPLRSVKLPLPSLTCSVMALAWATSNVSQSVRLRYSKPSFKLVARSSKATRSSPASMA